MVKGSKILLDQDYAREPVPMVQRRSWIRLALIWIAVGVDLSALVLGASLAMGMTMTNAIIAVSAGSLILATIGAVCSYVGSATGLSTAMINRFVFGERGAYIVIIVTCITGLGWFGVAAGFFGESVHVVTNDVFGWDIGSRWFALVGGLLMTLTAAIGFKAIERLSVISVPIMVSFLVGLFLKLLLDGNLGGLFTIAPQGQSMGLGTAVSLVVGAFIVGAAGSPDISRWAKSRKDAVLSGFFGFLIGNSLMMIVAVFLSRLTGTEDVIQIMLSVGWGLIAILILILSQWTTSDNGVYSMGLYLSVLFKWIPKRVMTIVVGLLGTGFAVMGVYQNFIMFLTMLSPFVAPIAGIYLIEFFVHNRDRFQVAFLREQKVAPFYWHSLFVWIMASIIALATTPSMDGGLGWFSLTHVPSLDGLLSAMLIQWMLGRFFPGNFVLEQKESKGDLAV